MRSMDYCSGRIFSVSDDGQMLVNDLRAQKVAQEYNFLKKEQIGKYVPAYKKSPLEIVDFKKEMAVATEHCPTCLGVSENAQSVIVGYSDDSLIFHDIRSNYQERMQLEAGAHDGAVKCISFSKDCDYLFLTGGSDKTLKLWDLR